MARPPSVVELVGPAGAGKTTLASLLEARGKAIRVTMWEIPAWRLTRSALRHLPMALAQYRDPGALRSEKIKHFARLDALPAWLHRRHSNSHRLVLLDEGPVYTLGWLQVMGHEWFREGRAQRWWLDTLRRWAQTLGAVVLLDAPDAVLAARIQLRDKPHLMKNRSVLEVTQFLAAYRAATARVLADLAAADGPPVLTLESGEDPHSLGDRLLATLEHTVHAG